MLYSFEDFSPGTARRELRRSEALIVLQDRELFLSGLRLAAGEST